MGKGLDEGEVMGQEGKMEREAAEDQRPSFQTAVWASWVGSGVGKPYREAAILGT